MNLLLVQRFICDPPYFVRHKGRIDWTGLGFMAVGLGALQLMLEKGQGKDWFASQLITWLAVLAAAGLVLFVWRELTIDRPAVDLRADRAEVDAVRRVDERRAADRGGAAAPQGAAADEQVGGDTGRDEQGPRAGDRHEEEREADQGAEEQAAPAPRAPGAAAARSRSDEPPRASHLPS